MTKALFLIQFAATWYLVGLCWLVQRVQYPLMDLVGRTQFSAYEQAHVTRIGPVVAPVMIVEAATGLAVLALGGAAFRSASYGATLGLLTLVWLSTFLVQVPLHGALADGFDPTSHSSLVATNWIRTIAWTARGVLLAWMLWAVWMRDAA